MAKKPPLEPGRRPLAKDERVFRYTGRNRCGRHHTWIDWLLPAGHGSVVVCGVCGRVKRDQTMPARLGPLV